MKITILKNVFNYAFRKTVLLSILFGIICSFTLFAQNFPSGFSQVQVANIYYPTSMIMAPDGRIFTTEKAGKVKVIKNGSVLPTPFLVVSVDQMNERGLSGIVLDPAFSTNQYVYIFYTTAASPIHNRLSRFTANGDVALAGSEKVIMDFEPLLNSIHNGGGMAFGEDGKLYLAIGNDNVNSYSQSLDNYKGKVLRINSDGSVPAGNPFSGSEAAKRIWAYGLRNPWSLDIQKGSGKIFVNDVGEGAWEEINDATIAGRNFGWPAAEGNSSNPAYTNPLYAYHHGFSNSDEGCAITGGVFFNSSVGNYPSQYGGKYFFIDYCGDWINYLDLSSGVVKNNFATSLPGAGNYIKQGNDGNLYYFSISTNALYKIIYSGNNSPLVTLQPEDVTVSQGQAASFKVSVSGAAPFTYQWQKNTVNIPSATSSVYSINSVQPGDAGSYRVKVTNSYGSVTSNAAKLTVNAYNAKPVAKILTPSAGALYRGGETISFSGTATDNEDGTLPASAFEWRIDFHHDVHIHPGPYVPLGVNNGTFTISKTGELSANVYYRLFLIVKDSKGLTDTTYTDIRPRTCTLSLASQPSGLQVLLDGQPHATPFSVLAVSGMIRALDVSEPQTQNNISYVFDVWSQGGSKSQSFTVTDQGQSFTAKFKTSGGGTSCSASGSTSRDVWYNVQGATIKDIPVNSPPSATTELSIFEGPTEVADHYASRIRGYICPPVDGQYAFWIASDNQSELWLSTNDQPGNKIRIAYVSSYTNSREWTKLRSQRSAAINLLAGKKYYIEALHIEDTRGDNLAVGWEIPGRILERPIPGSRLSPFTVSSGAPVVKIISPLNNDNFPSPVNIKIDATVSSQVGISKLEFFQGSTKIGETTTAPYSYTWMNVITGNYVLKAIATDITGIQGTSAVVNITVTGCPTPVITASGPLTMCSGSVMLNTSASSGNIYQWKKDGVDMGGATASSYLASSTGDYQVKVISGSCIAWSAPVRVSIQGGLSASITPAGPTSFCQGGSVMLYANTCSGYLYQWKRNDLDIAAATQSVYQAFLSGTYQLMVTQNAVSAWSAMLTVTQNACREGEAEKRDMPQELVLQPAIDHSFQMKVYPNPNNGQFTIAVNMAAGNEERMKMKVVNMLGQAVYQNEFAVKEQFVREVVELDETLPTGVYTLQMMVGDHAENTSIVLSR